MYAPSFWPRDRGRDLRLDRVARVCPTHDPGWRSAAERATARASAARNAAARDPADHAAAGRGARSARDLDDGDRALARAARRVRTGGGPRVSRAQPRA